MSNYPTTPLTGVTVADLGWFAGNWRGKIKEDRIEECWSQPSGDSMMAMFRGFTGDRVRFYEFILIEPDDNRIVMRLKHFNPGLIGWEEKEQVVEFVLTQLEGKTAVFLQKNTEKTIFLIYSRENNETLTAYFDRGQDTAKVDKFVYKRFH